jgi:chemotaxis family two-component system response regulator Rcp1
MMDEKKNKEFNVLYIEDNPADIRLTKELIQESELIKNFEVVKDGVEAISYLKKEGKYSKANRPDLILLDLNLPKKNGLDVLWQLKQDKDLRRIPVVILTISDNEEDLLKAYDMHANCYINKPLDIKEFYRIIKLIEEFWFTIVKLPGN